MILVYLAFERVKSMNNSIQACRSNICRFTLAIKYHKSWTPYRFQTPTSIRSFNSSIITLNCIWSSSPRWFISHNANSNCSDSSIEIAITTLPKPCLSSRRILGVWSGFIKPFQSIHTILIINHIICDMNYMISYGQFHMAHMIWAVCYIE